METKYIPQLDRDISRIGLGTWAIGGWMWGGTDRQQSIDTIHRALDLGINLIDTAPVYGFGTSEEIVGEAVEHYRGQRADIVLSTKAALEWDENEKIHRNASETRLRQEIEDSLHRLRTDYIDIYFIHWPDHHTPFEETARVMQDFLDQGKVRAIGVSNFDPKQMDAFRKTAPIHFLQPPYNIFERAIEEQELPYCRDHHIHLMTYGAICRGLLSGKMSRDQQFKKGDLRRGDPKFKQPHFDQYLEAVHKLDLWARENHNKRVIHLAARWILDNGIDTALWGARQPAQLEAIKEVQGWHLTQTDLVAIDRILEQSLQEEVGPEFMAPTER
jgi:aryl-alcohol dehydrogenase-like predicted oxidoreductase